MVKLEDAYLYKDCLLMLRVRHNKQWWGMFLMTDLSLQIVHECSADWGRVNPLGECEKCGTKFGFEENPTGGYKLDYISYAYFNHSNMYSLQNKNTTTSNIDRILDVGDPLIAHSTATTIDDIVYKYLRYRAGFSLILHGKTGMTEMHVSALFLNEGEENLVETKEGQCKLCQDECKGAEMRGFLVLKAQLG